MGYVSKNCIGARRIEPPICLQEETGKGTDYYAK
jgi:hypothetical protein